MNLFENINIKVKPLAILLFVIGFKISVGSTHKNIIIKGSVLNKKTNVGVSFCNVTIEGSLIGTFTNEEGEFVLKVKKLPVSLIFSHISFEEQQINIINESTIEYLNIKLIPLMNVLEEVPLESTERKKDFFAINLVRKAIKKLRKSSVKNKYGKAFYRQKSKNNDEYTELSEIIFDTQYTSDGIEDWSIIEGRYALKENEVNNKNFTLFSKITKALQPNTDDVYFPLHPQFEKYYEVYRKQTLKTSNGNIVILKFKPIIKNVPIFSAEVFINEKTKEVYKIKGRVINDKLNLVSFSDENSRKKEYELSYEISYKKNNKFGLVLDYININQEFDLYKKEVKDTHIQTSSSLMFYEHYTKKEKKKVGGQFSKGKSDWEKLNELTYNKKFWEENPIIKRTPVENDVIASFEENNAFESIFINSRNQISFGQKELEKDAFLTSLTTKIKDFNKVNPIEKLYLHTDRDIYYKGEDLWFSAFAKLAENKNNLLSSNLLFVDLIDQNNKLILSQTVELIEGRASGTINVSKKLQSGVYQLRAYTNWMRNFNQKYFYKKRIKIFTEKKYNNKPEQLSEKNNEIDLQFFPEGGNIIDGLLGRVAFKAIGVDGRGVKVRGKVVNNIGEKVANLVSIANGAGSFKLKPVLRENYSVILEDGSMYNLPKVIKSGYSIFANNLSEKSVRLRVQATKDLINSSFYVVGQIENKKCFQGKYKFGGKLVVEVEVPKNNLPSGVMTLSILDENFIPRSERVVFINSGKEIIIKAKISKKQIKPRGKVNLDIEVVDSNGNPVKSSLSIAVTNADKFAKNKFSSNIVSNFLLESDLRGYIENPGALFKNQERGTLLRLDLVMQTNGWRKINISKLNDSTYNAVKKHNFNETLEVSGVLRSKYNKLQKNKRFTMVAKSPNKIWAYKGLSDEFGRFKINDFMQSDSTEVVFNVYNSNNELIESKAILDKKNKKNLLPKTNFKYSPEAIYSLVDRKFIKQAEVKSKADSIFKVRNGDVLLNEVIVSGKIKKFKKRVQGRPSTYGIEPDAVVYTKDRSENTIVGLLRGVPGVRIGVEGISIRGGSGSPLFVIDGMPVFNPAQRTSGSGDEQGPITQGQNSNAIPSRIGSLNTFDVERIEVLKGPNAAVYGVRGGNGVILIYTKKANFVNGDDINLSNHLIMGTSVSKEFYSPMYDMQLPMHTKKDLRTTIYWNPLVVTDENGKARLTFYNTDEATNFQISVEGFSLYGLPGAYLKTIIKD